MRSAWKVRFAGLPPVRRAAAGIASRTRSASRADDTIGDRRPLPHHRRRDPPGEPLLAVLPQHPGQLAGRVGVHDVGGRRPGRRVHPHVQRRVLRVGEAAPRLVQLQRGDPEVEQHPVAPGTPRRRPAPPAARSYTAGAARPATPNGASRSPASRSASGSRSIPTSRQRGVRLQQGLRVPAQPERRVHRDRVRPGQRGREQRQHPVPQDRHVQRPSRPSRPLRMSPPWRLLAPPGPVRPGPRPLPAAA